MRQTILLTLLGLLAVGTAHRAFGQHNGGSERGFSGGGHASHLDRGGRNFNRNRSGSPYGYGYAFLPPYDDGYLPDGSDNGYAYQPLPPVDYDQQPPQPVLPPVQPVAHQTAHPFVKEYNWPAVGTTPTAVPTTESEPLVFAIVLKDGSTLSATMVLASADSLHYVDTDGRLRHVAVGAVDRAATLKLARAKNLSLYIPAAE